MMNKKTDINKKTWNLLNEIKRHPIQSDMIK